jgi:integrase
MKAFKPIPAEHAQEAKKIPASFDRQGVLSEKEQRRIVGALVNLEIDFFADRWSLEKLDGRMIDIKRDRFLIFEDEGSWNKKYKLGWLKNYVKYELGRRIVDDNVNAATHLSDLRSLGYFSTYIIGRCQNLKDINKGILLHYEDTLLSEKFSTANTCKLLSTPYRFLDMLGIVTGWRPPKLKFSSCHVDEYLSNNKKKLPPEEVIMQINTAAGQIADAVNGKMKTSELSTADYYDMFTMGELIIQLATFTRLNEVLSLNVECEHFGDSGEYALVITVEKPIRQEIRTVAPEFAETVMKVIATIKKMTHITREYIKFWEKKGDVQYAIKGKQKMSESLFCFFSTTSLAKKTLTKKTLKALKKGRKICRRDFSRMIGGAMNRYLCPVPGRRRYDVRYYRELLDISDLCAYAFGKGELFRDYKLRPNLKRVFEKYSITYNGELYALNTHQLRHYTTTKMMNNGADQAMTDKLHGRQTRGQSETYFHPTDDDIKEISGDMDKSLCLKSVNEIDVQKFVRQPIEIDHDMRNEVFKLMEKGLILGSTAKFYKKIQQQLESGEMSQAEFEHMKWQIMPMISKPPLLDVGLCMHSWYENPCLNHYGCLLDDYGKICKSLSPIVHASTIKKCEKIINDLEFSLTIARKKEPDEYVDRWIENIEKKITHTKAIMYDVKEQIEHVTKKEIIHEEKKQTKGRGIKKAHRDNIQRNAI